MRDAKFSRLFRLRKAGGARENGRTAIRDMVARCAAHFLRSPDRLGGTSRVAVCQIATCWYLQHRERRAFAAAGAV